jgi:hypothetical protein
VIGGHPLDAAPHIERVLGYDAVLVVRFAGAALALGRLFAHHGNHDWGMSLAWLPLASLAGAVRASIHWNPRRMRNGSDWRIIRPAAVVSKPAATPDRVAAEVASSSLSVVGRDSFG